MVERWYGCTTPFGMKTPIRLRPPPPWLGYAHRGIWGGSVARRVRIVVGEGRTAQRGLLRFVLEGEGFDVVGEAKGTADLSAVIEAKEPDVVVLDDGIGVVAVSMVHEVAPRAKIVLVWPAAVVPIGGDARVEPAKILRDLGAAVTHVMAPVTALTETFERPDWIDKVRKDPATLRSKLSGVKDTKARPSVTRLQRRSKRLHPHSERSRPIEPGVREEEVPAPVVVLPVGTGGNDLEPVLDIGGGSAGANTVEEPVDDRSDWNRRLGTLALSGAAAVSALVLALALGGGRVPAVIRGSDGIGLVPIGVPGFSQGGGVGESPFGRGPGAGGLQPGAIEEPGSEQGGGTQVDGGLGGDLANPGSRGNSEEPTPPEEPGGDGTGTGGDNDGGNDGGGGGAPSDGLPGRSAEHNPHGGPPGQLGITPAHGPGLGAGASAEHGSHRHSHKH
jgi:hypothetical protein